MLQTSMDVLKQFPVRKTKKQKLAFRQAVCNYAKSLGYPVTVEKGSLGSRNVVMGDPVKAKYLVTAHYDTCAKLPVPNLLTPCSPVGFLVYQLFLLLIMLVFGFLMAIAACLLLAGIGTIAGASFAEALILCCAALCPVLTPLNLIPVVLIFTFGPANRYNANDNTSGVVTLLEIARTMPENQRNKVCFVLFDLEEAGLIGSASYRKVHKNETDCQIVLNLDCVGDGDTLLLFPTKALQKDRKRLTSLYRACGYFGKKSLAVREKGFGIYPSDQMNFPYGVGICALRKSKFGLYVGRIHTVKDTVLDETNVNILRAALTSYICCDAVQQERKK